MVRTLVFLEGLVAVALALLMPFIVRDFALAALAPLAFVLLIPFAASLAVHPLAFLREAFGAAFKGKPPAGGGLEAVKALGEFGAYVRRAALIGLLVALSFSVDRLAEEGPSPAFLALGLWLVLYGVLVALAARILALAVARLAETMPVETRGKAGEAVVEDGVLSGGPEPATGSPAFRTRFGLSPREWEVARTMASGASYKETADLLFISLSTVKAHLSSVYRKTGTRDKVELLLLMRREDAWE